MFKKQRENAQKAPHAKSNASEFPMRLNKYLARAGKATRREADEFIAEGRVFVNGKRAKVGDKVQERDQVDLRFKKPREHLYVAFNKPAGMDTHQEATGTRSVIGTLPPELQAKKLFPVGRLDQASRGLILLTNDGRVTDRLLSPERAHEKTYEVTVKQPLRARFKDHMEQGVDIEGYVTKPAQVAILGEKRFRITLTEGKSHQIRRMVAALFNEVADLRRTRIGSVKLGPLKEGGHRVLEGEERTAFLSEIGLA
jgi:23S rRNA pseudouridine2604 synthase